MGDLVIREAEAGDADQIAELLTQLGYPATGGQVSERLDYWRPDPMSLILVAELAGRVAGCLSLHAIPYLERTGRCRTHGSTCLAGLTAECYGAGVPHR